MLSDWGDGVMVAFEKAPQNFYNHYNNYIKTHILNNAVYNSHDFELTQQNALSKINDALANEFYDTL